MPEHDAIAFAGPSIRYLIKAIATSVDLEANILPVDLAHRNAREEYAMDKLTEAPTLNSIKYVRGGWPED